MEYVRQTMKSADLSGLIDLPPTLRDTKVEIIVLSAENEVPKKPKKKISFDFLKDKVPPLPDSFFDPLPEEELQAWEL